MFQLVTFPPEALDDIRRIVQLSSDQLIALSEMLDNRNAAPPSSQEFEDSVRTKLGLDFETAEVVVQSCLIFQTMNLTKENAGKVVKDFEYLIRTENPVDSKILLDLISDKRQFLVELVTRKQEVTREIQRREIVSGMQSSIESIRTFVQLRPLFHRDEEKRPVGIECLIPAMTLEIKYKRDGREHSATFSLTEETLVGLTDALEDAKTKWDILKKKYSNEICE